MEINYTTQTVTLPDSIYELGKDRYLKIIDLVQELELEEHELFKMLILMDIIQLFCNITEKELDEFTTDELNNLATTIVEKIKTFNVEK